MQESQAALQEKDELESQYETLQREIQTACSAEHIMQEHLEGLRQLLDVMNSLEGQERINLRLRLRNEVRRLIDRIEIYPEGAARVFFGGKNISASVQNLELHLHFHSGPIMFLYPRMPGAINIEFPEGYEGEY